MRSNQQSGTVPHILFAVTVSISCGFYRGMLRHLEEAGFSTTMVSAPGALLEEVGGSQGAEVLPIPMEREIRPFRDVVSLFRLYRTMKAVRPVVGDVSAPRSGFFGA